MLIFNRQTEAANAAICAVKGRKKQSWLCAEKQRRQSRITHTFFVAVRTAALYTATRCMAAAAAGAVEVYTVEQHTHCSYE